MDNGVLIRRWTLAAEVAITSALRQREKEKWLRYTFKAARDACGPCELRALLALQRERRIFRSRSPDQPSDLDPLDLPRLQALLQEARVEIPDDIMDGAPKIRNFDDEDEESRRADRMRAPRRNIAVPARIAVPKASDGLPRACLPYLAAALRRPPAVATIHGLRASLGVVCPNSIVAEQMAARLSRTPEALRGGTSLNVGWLCGLAGISPSEVGTGDGHGQQQLPEPEEAPVVEETVPAPAHLLAEEFARLAAVNGELNGLASRFACLTG